MKADRVIAWGSALVGALLGALVMALVAEHRSNDLEAARKELADAQRAMERQSARLSGLAETRAVAPATQPPVSAVPASDAQAEPTAPEPPSGLEPEDLPAFEATLSEELDAQPRDGVWARDAERILGSSFASLEDKGLRLLNLRCGTDICRTELDLTTASDVSNEAVKESIASTRLSFLHIVRADLPSAAHDVLYVAREGRSF